MFPDFTFQFVYLYVVIAVAISSTLQNKTVKWMAIYNQWGHHTKVI